MRQKLIDVLEEAYGAWRFRWLALGVAWAVGVCCWIIVFAAWHDTYRATARVFVDTRTALKPVLEGLAVAQDVDAQLNYVRQSLLGTPQLEKIATETKLLSPGIGSPIERAKILEDMRDRISINVRTANDAGNERQAGGNVYGIGYKDPDRERSLKVVQELLAVLVDETLGGKRQGSVDAQRFLEGQIKEYEQRLRSAEERLAAFKKGNVGVMPTEQGGYFQRLQAEIEAIRTTDVALQVAASRRDEFERQLRGESAVTAVSVAPAGGAKDSTAGSGGDVVSRIRETQAKLDELLLKFTDKHPDVIATRENLEELKRRRDREVTALRNGDPDAVASSGVSTNPVYQSVQVGLNQSEIEIATLRRQLNAHREREQELRRALDSMPQVEAQFYQLNRDYDVNKTQYTALMTQLEKAKLGQEAEADSSGSVRFDVIEPPNVGYRLVMPSRRLLIVVVLGVALVAGGFAAYLRSRMLPVFWSHRKMAAQLGVTVLGTVGGAFPLTGAQAMRKDLGRYLGGAGALVAVCLILIGLNVMTTHSAVNGLALP